MHRVLKRQLRRALALTANEDVERFMQELHAGAPVQATISLDNLVGRRAFAALIGSVEETYSQLERDLDLRTRSLDISSQELFELNTRLRHELAAVRLAESTLRAAANHLAGEAGLPPLGSDATGLSPLSSLVANLVREREEARAAQAVSERQLKLAMQASNLGLWEWNVESPQIFFDRTLCRLLGREEIDRHWGGDELARISHPEDGERFMGELRRILRGEIQLFSVEHRVRHANGGWVWLQTFGNVTNRSGAGRALRMNGTYTDVSHRKNIERAAADSLRLLETLLETLPLPVIIRDADRHVTQVNAAWEKMLGISRQDIVGKQIDSDPRRMRTKNHRETDDELIATKKPLRYETSVHAVDGSIYNVIIAKTPLLAEDGAITGIASVVTDISAQKHAAVVLQRAKFAAESAVEAKSRFLANMSHELRTPLNGVVGMASLLDELELEPKPRRFVRTLRSSAEALVTIIDDILDLSKIEAGKLEISRTTVNLRREVEQVVNLFGPRAFDKGLELALHFAPDAPTCIHSDPTRLRQVLSNLVGNAIKFTEQGAVLVSLNMVEDGGGNLVEFSVSDTGVGIRRDHQKRVFDAFEQADGSITRRFGGTGLGLAISRQLVELLQGRLGVDSEPGRGSRFHFSLPLAGARDAQALPPDTTFAAIAVGTHPTIRAAICEALGRQAGRVYGCDSVLEAIEILNTLPSDVVRIRVVFDADSEQARNQSTVEALRIAAAPRALEIVALISPSADPLDLPGVVCSLVKPICTRDVLDARSANATHTVERPILKSPAASRGHALVVEDNAINQELARAMLEMLGFAVSIAVNGRDGVNAAAAREFNIILMDCQMPVLDGLAAARAIRGAERAGMRVPIIALTGNAMPGDREACVRAGMDDYLSKPINLAALRTCIDRWTESPGSATAVV